MTDMEHYYIPACEAQVAYNGNGQEGISVTRWKNKWFGIVGDKHFMLDEENLSADIGVEEPIYSFGVTWEAVRCDLKAGKLACFRCLVDGTPFQVPTALLHTRVDVPCPQCKRPNDPGYKSCWWCATPGRK